MEARCEKFMTDAKRPPDAKTPKDVAKLRCAAEHTSAQATQHTAVHNTQRTPHNTLTKHNARITPHTIHSSSHNTHVQPLLANYTRHSMLALQLQVLLAALADAPQCTPCDRSFLFKNQNNRFTAGEQEHLFQVCAPLSFASCHTQQQQRSPNVHAAAGGRPPAAASALARSCS